MKKTFIFAKLLALAVCMEPLFLPGQEAPDEILQKEMVRRQEIMLRAVKMVEEARALIAEAYGKTGEPDVVKINKAREVLNSTLEMVPNVGQGRDFHQQVRGILSELSADEAARLMVAKKPFEAKEKAEKALELNPANEKAQKVLAEVSRLLGTGMKKPGEINPALSQNFVDRLNRVEELIKKGRDFMGTGQYDKAEAAFREVLAVDADPAKTNDPYHLTASKELKRLYRLRHNFHEKARVLNELSNTRRIKEAWVQPVVTTAGLGNEKKSADSSSEAVPLTRRADFDIQQKLKGIILREVDFSEAGIADVAAVLTARSREADPDGQGVTFLVQEDVARQARPITLSLRDISLGEVLRYSTRLAEVKFRVEERAVLIVPLSARVDVLVRRDFPVRQQFIIDALNSIPEETPGAGRRPGVPIRPTAVSSATPSSDSVKKALENRGVEFAEGATAIYSPATGILTIRNTQDQIDLIEELIISDLTNQGVAKLIRVDARVVEINQEDLESLTFNYTLEGLAVGPNQLTGSHFRNGVNANIPTYGPDSLSANSIDGLIGAKVLDSIGGAAATPRSQNILSIRGFIDGNVFNAFVNALSQKKSANLLSAPSIVVTSGGREGVVEVIREFTYPTEWDAPQIQTFSTEDDGFILPFTIPAFPSEFIDPPTKVGISMTVKASADSENRKITMEVRPEIRDFDGFIDYGSRILEVPSIQAGSPNSIRVPIFTVRTFEGANLDVQDGYTMVVGGLIREDIQAIEDKVPVLGDIPLLGRLFRGKTERSIRKNMLLFITPRILGPDGQPVNPSAGGERVASISN